MSSVTIELPPQATQTQFNLRRWAELLADPEVAKIEWRVETDRYGHIVVMPPPAPKHGSFQSRIAFLLQTLLPDGRTITECPISTADGVKGADVAWASPERMAELGSHSCFPRSPEICVEVRSPDNTDAEIREKTALYIDAGAKEVWVCGDSGTMSFFGMGLSSLSASKLCPNFPRQIELR
ncbi:MAG: Uma2 family endonuclease [Verrucomicrobia bacterium]|nr:Uma2 family endonuclease [Verrucomicrobiota bacterium]